MIECLKALHMVSLLSSAKARLARTLHSASSHLLVRSMHRFHGDFMRSVPLKSWALNLDFPMSWG